MIRWLRQNFEFAESSEARLRPMEGLRGIAVLLVFLQHFGTQGVLVCNLSGITGVVADSFSEYGNLGVELFFILSGFLIYGTLVRKRPPFGRYMRRRYQRIYPAFLVAFVLAICIAWVTSSSKIPAGAVPTLVYLVENLLLLPGVFPGEPALTVAWSLSYEMFFYWTAAAIVAGLDLNRRSRGFRVSLIVVAAIGLAVAHQVSPSAPIRMIPFFAGMLLYEAMSADLLLSSGKVAGVAQVVALVIAADHGLPAIIRELSFTFGFAAVCWACFSGRNAIAAAFTFAPIRWLGNMSYSYYLLHGFVVRVSFELISRAVGETAANGTFWSWLLPVFVVSLVPSALLFLFIEKPLSLTPPRRLIQPSVGSAG